MSDVFTMAVEALRADQSRLQLLGQNAANATTPGYRRSFAVAQPFQQALDAAGATGRAAGASVGLPVVRPALSLQQAAHTDTGRALDAAIQGDGYFVVGDGERSFLTRAGSFRLSAQGVLMGPGDLPVQGRSGEIRPEQGAELSIAASGAVLAGGREIDRLRIVKPGEDFAPASSDGVLIDAGEQAYAELPPDEVVLRPGFLEASNTDNLREMLGLMETARHFESVTRLLQGYDEMMGKAIQKLGDV
ncbi:MAG: flagellar hook-basal body complex protein [Aquabacterium sp.]|nr:MAG: flagellar hook-basal body complex protein [Aquabacterium sp.]